MRHHKSKHLSVNPSGGTAGADFLGGGGGGGKGAGAGGSGRGSGSSSKLLSVATLPSLFMWLLNGALIAASIFALSNWTTVNWMTGSYGWAALLEIGALLLLLFLLLCGVFLFGWASRVESSFVHLADSPQLLYLFALAMPFLTLSFFGLLALLALVNIPSTHIFIQTHAEAVFRQAASRAVNPNQIRVGEFINYICCLPSFDCKWGQKSGTPPNVTFAELVPPLPDGDKGWNFKGDLSVTFDNMAHGKTYLTVADVYEGVVDALRPHKERFGWAVLAIALICLLQFGYFWFKWWRHQKSNKGKAMDKEQMPFIGP